MWSKTYIENGLYLHWKHIRMGEPWQPTYQGRKHLWTLMEIICIGFKLRSPGTVTCSKDPSQIFFWTIFSVQFILAISWGILSDSIAFTIKTKQQNEAFGMAASGHKLKVDTQLVYWTTPLTIHIVNPCTHQNYCMLDSNELVDLNWVVFS